MKALLFITATLFSTFVIAKAPIDGLQKQNVSYLESKANQGFEFRSQIITEFDQAHASQEVNIKLSKDYSYIVVALGDNNISDLDLDIKPLAKARMEATPIEENLEGESHLIKPSKSGRFKITINASGLEGDDTGFISFMVLRKG